MLAQSIFSVQSDSRGKFADDFVGRFRTGYLDGRSPRSLQNFRVTSGDADVVNQIAESFGGTAQEWEATGEDRLEVFTETSKVSILVQPRGISTGFVMWGRAGKIRACDGNIQTWGDDVGQPCICAGWSLDERKEKSKQGIGCAPDISIAFRLADLPNLGLFRLQSGSFVLLKDIQSAELAVYEANEEKPATLGLEVVTMKNGKEFTKTVLKLK